MFCVLGYRGDVTAELIGPPQNFRGGGDLEHEDIGCECGCCDRTDGASLSLED